MNATPELVAAFNTILDKIEASISPVFTGAINMYVAGGIAVNYYCGTRYTEDVDASFSHRLLPLRGIEVSYKRSDGSDALLYLDQNYNPSFSLLHPEFEEVAVAWDELNNGRRIQVYVLHPIDLALSKISRLSDQDSEDILSLAARRLITSSALLQRAEEALKDYIGDPVRIKLDIAQVCTKIDKVQVSHGIDL